MARNKKAKRPRGLNIKNGESKNNEPTTKALMPWFIRYGYWLAMNIQEKQEEYPGEYEGIDQFAPTGKNGKKPKVKFRILKGTDREFAKLAGVRVETLCEWCHKSELWEYRNQHMNLSAKKLTPSAIRGLARNAMSKGQPHAVKAFIDYAEGGVIGKLKPTGKAHEPLGEAARGMLARYADRKGKKGV